METEIGLCKCGCGQKTSIAVWSNTARGWVKGQPVPYVTGHAARVRWANPLARFWSFVDKRGDNECWPWVGDKQAYGYGRFHFNGRQQIASRVMWQIINETTLTAKDCICHKCDNPICVNPSHLFVGTKADNNRDMDDKGRRKSSYGEQHYRAKLTEADVVEMRRIYKSGALNKTELAKKYSVSHSAVRAVLDGSHWKHLPT